MRRPLHNEHSLIVSVVQKGALASLTLVMTLMLFTMITPLACSSAPADSESTESLTGDASERRSDQDVHVKRDHSGERASDHQEPEHQEPESPLEVSACPDAYDCDPWRRSKRTPKLCNFPVALYTQKRAMVSESGAEELEVRWALLGRVREIAQASPPTSPRRLKGWTVLWRGVKRSEFLAGSHAERVKSVAKLKVPKDRRGGLKPVSAAQPCRDFILVKRQSARSFNRVDAREREFDEDDVEESRFSFSAQRNRYVEQTQPEPPKIRVRSR